MGDIGVVRGARCNFSNAAVVAARLDLSTILRYVFPPTTVVQVALCVSKSQLIVAPRGSFIRPFVHNFALVRGLLMRWRAAL